MTPLLYSVAKVIVSAACTGIGIWLGDRAAHKTEELLIIWSIKRNGGRLKELDNLHAEQP